MSESVLLLFCRILKSIVEFVLRGARCAVVHGHGLFIRGQDAPTDVLFLFMIIFRVHSVAPRRQRQTSRVCKRTTICFSFEAQYDEIHGVEVCLDQYCGARLWLAVVRARTTMFIPRRLRLATMISSCELLLLNVVVLRNETWRWKREGEHTVPQGSRGVPPFCLAMCEQESID